MEDWRSGVGGCRAGASIRPGSLSRTQSEGLDRPMSPEDSKKPLRIPSEAWKRGVHL